MNSPLARELGALMLAIDDRLCCRKAAPQGGGDLPGCRPDGFGFAVIERLERSLALAAYIMLRQGPCVSIASKWRFMPERRALRNLHDQGWPERDATEPFPLVLQRWPGAVARPRSLVPHQARDDPVRSITAVSRSSKIGRSEYAGPSLGRGNGAYTGRQYWRPLAIPFFAFLLQASCK